MFESYTPNPKSPQKRDKLYWRGGGYLRPALDNICEGAFPLVHPPPVNTLNYIF